MVGGGQAAHAGARPTRQPARPPRRGGGRRPPRTRRWRAFHRGVGIAAALVALGGVLGLVGIRNPRRDVPCEGCPGGQLGGGAARSSALAGRRRPRAGLTRRQRERARAPQSRPGVRLSRLAARCPRAGPARGRRRRACRACRGARRDAGPRSAARAALPALGTAAMGAIVGLGARHRARRRRAPVVPLGPRPARLPGWMVGPLAHRLPGAARQPADAPGRPHARARRRSASRGSSPSLCAPRVPAADRLERGGGDARRPAARPAAVADRRLQLPALRAHAGDLRRSTRTSRCRYRCARTPPTTSPTGITSPRPTARSSRCSPRRSPRSRCPRRTGRGRRSSLAAALGTLVLVALAARRLGRSPQAAVALVGLNPLVLVYGIGGAHNEPLVLLCGVAAVALAIVGWRGAGARGGTSRRAPAPSSRPASSPRPPCSRPSSCSACRRRLPALGGAGGAGALVLAVVALVYGGHLPATGIQDGLVGPLERAQRARRARPARGADGRRPRRRPRRAGAGRASRRAAAVAWRRAWLPGAAGFVMLAAVLTLGWTMPWYVWWVLPFAALARTRALAGACIVLTAWLALGAIPQMPKLIHAFGYYPTRTAPGWPTTSTRSATCNERHRRPRPRVPSARRPARPLRARGRDQHGADPGRLHGPRRPRRSRSARGRRRLGRRRAQRLPPQPRLDLPRRPRAAPSPRRATPRSRCSARRSTPPCLRRGAEQHLPRSRRRARCPSAGDAPHLRALPRLGLRHEVPA